MQSADTWLFTCLLYVFLNIIHINNAYINFEEGESMERENPPQKLKKKREKREINLLNHSYAIQLYAEMDSALTEGLASIQT